MTTKILTQTQTTTKPRGVVLNEWLSTVGTTLDALFAFQAYLTVWKAHPYISVDPDLFMDILETLAEVGLLDWLDGNPVDCPGGISPRDIDALRNAVCTKE